MRMAGKVALITGSTRGIGQATAERMAQEGAKVVVTGRNDARGEAVVAGICAAGGDAIYVHADLLREEDVKAAVEAAVARYGKLTTLINNATAGDVLIKHDRSIAEITNEGWNHMLTVGLTAVMWACRYAVPKIREAGGGSIVHISSSTSILGSPGNDAYIATKGALNALTRSMAYEFAPDKIRVNCVVPGFVVSGPEAEKALEYEPYRKALEELILMPFGKPMDIAHAILFVASDEAAYMTGASLVMDGGLTCKQAVPYISDIPFD